MPILNYTKIHWPKFTGFVINKEQMTGPSKSWIKHRNFQLYLQRTGSMDNGKLAVGVCGVSA